MLKQSPGRNQRSKGIKVKHVLQVCFLIVICFWLIYQVKHSHDKKKEFDESDATISVRTQISNEGPKLGRKDLQPKVEETATIGEKQDEEAAEEEERVGEEEQQQLEQKFEDKEDEGKGVGEDELDEHEQEKTDAEVDREEEVTEEEVDEKANEENDSGDNNGDLDNEKSLEDHEHEDETAKSTHEAREEHYKADDASSEVTHETQVVADENENQDSENSNEMNKSDHEMDKSGDESEVHKSRVGENTTDAKTEEPEIIEKSHPANTTANEAVHDVSSKSEERSLSSNSSSVDQSNDQLVNNAKEEITWADGSSTQNVAVEGTTSGDGSILQNVSLDQADRSNFDASTHKGDPKLATSEKTGETDSSSEYTTNSSLPTGGSGSSTTSDKLDNDEGTYSQESDASKTENQVEVQNDPTDSSDSSVTVRTELDTLPEIQTEANNNIEDSAAE